MDKLPSSFNIFDIFVRLIPGTIFTTWVCYVTGKLTENFTILDSMIFLFVAYIVGVILRAPAKLVLKLWNWIWFGGNPRERYTVVNKRFRVIRDEGTVLLARKNVNDICEKY